MSEPKQATILAFEESFSITEESYKSGFSTASITGFDEAAAEVLTAVIALEQMSYEHIDKDMKGIASEIHRLDQKLDFITELLVKVLQSQQPKLEKTSVKMSAENISWQSKLPLNEGSFCLLSLHLSQKYPTPLQLPIEVSSMSENESENGQVQGRILLSDETVIDDLTRMVFLYHRRQIARNRA